LAGPVTAGQAAAESSRKVPPIEPTTRDRPTQTASTIVYPSNTTAAVVCRLVCKYEGSPAARLRAVLRNHQEDRLLNAALPGPLRVCASFQRSYFILGRWFDPRVTRN